MITTYWIVLCINNNYVFLCHRCSVLRVRLKTICNSSNDKLDQVIKYLIYWSEMHNAYKYAKMLLYSNHKHLHHYVI